MIFINFLTLPTYSFLLKLDISTNTVLVTEEEEHHHGKDVTAKIILPHLPDTVLPAESASKQSTRFTFWPKKHYPPELSSPTPPPDFQS